MNPSSRGPGRARRRRRGACALACLAACWALALAAPAGAQTLAPTGNGFFTGLTGGSYPAFEHEVGRHAAVNGCS